MKKLALLVGVTLFVLLGCAGNDMSSHVHQRTETLMNAPIDIRIFDLECTGINSDDRCTLLDEAFDLLFDLERRWTVHNVGGEVERINEMAGVTPVLVEENTFYLIEQAIYYSIYSDWLFNAAIGPLTQLWSIGRDAARRPIEDEITKTLPLLDPMRITLDSEAHTVFLEDAGMRLDLGAIAKGYMADLVVELFVRNNVNRALLIIGGEVIALGGRQDGSPFRVAIQNPFPSSIGNELVGTIPLYNQAAITSGTYNRYFLDQTTGTRYHHIFDSRTGLPFDSDVVSITVVSDTGLIGEVYSTILFALGIQAGMDYVESLPGIEALFISTDQGIYLSSGLQDAFELLLDDAFEIHTVNTP